MIPLDDDARGWIKKAETDSRDLIPALSYAIHRGIYGYRIKDWCEAIMPYEGWNFDGPITVRKKANYGALFYDAQSLFRHPSFRHPSRIG